MRGVNKVILVGTLGKDPKLNSFQTAAQLLNFLSQLANLG